MNKIEAGGAPETILSLGVALSMYKVIAAYKPEDTTIEKVGVL